MKRNSPHIFFKSIVTIFLVAYVIGSFTDMRYIPRYMPDVQKTNIIPALANMQLSHANLSRINFLQVFDKSTVDNDAINELSFMPKSLDISFRLYDSPDAKGTDIQPPNYPHHNCQYSYLAFCTFRI